MDLGDVSIDQSIEDVPTYSLLFFAEVLSGSVVDEPLLRVPVIIRIFF